MVVFTNIRNNFENCYICNSASHIHDTMNDAIHLKYLVAGPNEAASWTNTSCFI